MANDQHTELDTEQKLDHVKEQLIEHGKKRSSLTYKEIMEKLSPFDQDPEQIDEFFEQLDDLGIEVLNENDEDHPLRGAGEEQEREQDDFNFDDDLALPPGIKINDPVRM
ncbi:RNA polymerase sigma factor region1.1 domain-containing protein, partial [Paenibacillus sp. MCAF20]